MEVPRSPRPEQIPRRKLYQEVMDRLIELIKAESLAEGDQLPSERDLMDRYGVGRPAVREALQNLAWMGVINISHGERARIVRPSFKTLLEAVAPTTHRILHASERGLEELKEARLVFEIQMVRLAAERAGPEDVRRLATHLEDQRAARSKPRDFIRCDMHFHREIASITGNSIFPALSETMMGWLAEFYVDLVRVPGAEHVTLAEHARILEAVAAHDVAEAERAMREHITRANELYHQATQPGPGASDRRALP